MTYKCKECACFSACEDWALDHVEMYQNFPYEGEEKPCVFYRPESSLAPFDIGDLVYYVEYRYDKEIKKHLPDRIEQGKVSAMTLKADKTWKIRVTTHYRSVIEYKFEDFGKTIFSTEAQAQVELGRLKLVYEC